MFPCLITHMVAALIFPGIQYRELQTGSGQVAEAGSTLDITYTV